MLAKICLNLLLVFCGVLSQGIIGTLSQTDIEESSQIIFRPKRVINKLPAGDIPERIIHFPYIVFIREYNRTNHCPGTVVSRHIVLTAAKCVLEDDNAYRVYSGIAHARLSNNHATHTIIDKRTFYGIHPFRAGDGLSLITVHPPFVLSQRTQIIKFYEGNLSPGIPAIVSGWGCEERRRGTNFPDSLRSIYVPIISLQECTNRYLRLFAITQADICTLDPTGHQYCTVKDVGAPLVIEVNNEPHLAGIHLWNGGVVGRLNPDVFINLQDNWYKRWIMENIHAMEGNVHNHNPHIQG